MSNLTERTTYVKTLPSTSVRCVRAGVVALLLTALWLTSVGSASADFGISTFTSDFQDVNGLAITQAGSHADVSTFLHFNTRTDGSGNVLMEGQARDIEVDMPAGFYGNPQAMPACSMQEIIDSDGYCQPAAQVGVLNYEIPGTGGFFADFPVYNLRSTDLQTAVLGVVAVSVPAKIIVSVRTAGDYGIRARLSNLNQALSLTKTRLTLWGVPADPVHDVQRFYPNGGLFGSGAPAGVPPRPFLSLPARCEPMTTTIRADSWQNPGKWVSASVTSPPLTGCDQLKFDAALRARPQTTAAGQPAGYDVRLTIPQDESVKGLATPQLRKAVVALPVGTRVSAASADGLGACTDAELKLGTAEEPVCPESAKVGTVTVETPVLKNPLKGDIILGSQRPDQLLRLFFVVRGPGLLLKIPGKVDPDPLTGQLVATFDGTPQLPFTTLSTSFKGGSYAALSNPKTCGTYTSVATLTPWSGGAPVQASDSFVIDSRCDQAGKFEPVLNAGVVDATSGASSPFVFKLSRPTGQQDIGAVDVTMPPGLVAHVEDVPLCVEALAAVGECPAASQIGRVRAAVGAGASPLVVPDRGKAPTAVFLAGPYKGAPFSLSIVVPAQAGPFDLGTVVVRAAIFVDPNTAQISVRSDPLPVILKGIPIDMQDLTVILDRPGFMINPTSCDPSQLHARVASTEGRVANLLAPFQATGCASLPYQPKLTMSLTGKGQTTDGKHPSLSAHLEPRSGDANLKQARVILPLSLALDPDNANGLCEPVDALLDRCQSSSIVGRAKAVSVLHQPLESPVYFVRGERRDPRTGRVIKTLPKLFIPLKGEGVTVNVSANSEVPDDEHLVSTFENLPDVPLKSFDLTIAGGAHGILVVSGANLCAGNQVATAQLAGQNGKKAESDVAMGTPCPLSVRGAGHDAASVKFTVGGVGGGRVSVAGRGLRRSTRTISAATVVTMRARLTTAARRSLASGQDVIIRAVVSYTPKDTQRAQRVTRRIVVHG